MLSQIFVILVGALIFGTAAVCGALAASAMLPRLRRFDDGPAPVDLHPAYLIVAAALFGGLMASRHLPNPEFVTVALAVVPLVAIWYCDLQTGIVPDAFTLIPLAAIVAYSAFLGEWFALISAAVLFVPFAGAALLSKGRGMGWGDAKLAAFGGAMLGMSHALLAFGVASLAAVIVGSIRYRSKQVPIAFAPYLVAGIVVTIVVVAR